MLLALQMVCVACLAASPAPAPRGLWLLPRKDAANSARCDVPGRMVTAPREIWSIGGGRDQLVYCQPVRVGGRPMYFGQVGAGVRLLDRSGRVLWQETRLAVTSVIGVGDLRGVGGVEAIVAVGSTSAAMLDVESGKTLWTWSPPNGAYLGSCKLLVRPGRSRFVCFPLNTLAGYCFRLGGKDGKPDLLWEQTYPNTYWAGYGPQIALADMDNDSAPEVVVAGKPGFAGVVDLGTGDMRYSLRYQVTDGPDIGRPYGLLNVEDLDGDGYRDIVMLSCQVEEYAAVIRNMGGKGLKHVWSQFVEKDYPEDRVELRPNVTSAADLDGDGRRELVIGLYNMTGDAKWHTVALDPMGGYRARRLDLAGRYFWGCFDLNGDGVAEIVTSSESARRPAPASDFQIVDGRTGRDLAVIAGASLSTWTGPLENHQGFMALRASPVFVRGPTGGLAVRRRGGSGPEELWRIEQGRGVAVPFRASADARAILVTCPATELGDVDVGFRGGRSSAGFDASCARVCEVDGKREIVVDTSDGKVIGGMPDWRRKGRFRQSWEMPGRMPAVWQGPHGDRVVCTAGPTPEELHIGRPTAGGRRTTDAVRVPLRYPIYSYAGATSTATLIPFGDDVMRLFVGLQTGVHTLACALYDAAGKEQWLNASTGPYPRSAAAARLEAGGPYRLIVNDHYNKTVYDLEGRPVLELGYGSMRGGIMVNSPYALPVVGPYGPDGAERIVLLSGLDTIQVLDRSGAILANRHFNTYEFEYCGPTVASIRPGLWDAGMANHDGVFHCIDLRSGQSRWTMDLGVKASAFNVTAVDVDGDGRDNFLIGLPNGTLLALDEVGGKGIVLWRVSLPAGIRDAIAADADGDGAAEIIVETADGTVRVLGPARATGARRASSPALDRGPEEGGAMARIELTVDRKVLNPVRDKDPSARLKLTEVTANGSRRRLLLSDAHVTVRTVEASGGATVAELVADRVVAREGGVARVTASVVRDGSRASASVDVTVAPFYRDYHQTLVTKLFLGMEGTPVERLVSEPLFQKAHDVLCTFEEALEVIRKTDNLTRGVPKIVYLVGWQKGGHDHLYPSWDEVNPRLKRAQDPTALDSLRWLIRAARRYHTTVSLHLNMVDAYRTSPLWEEYVAKDCFARDAGGKLLVAGIAMKGEEMHNVVYPREWEAGLAQRRIDRLIAMIPELREGHTIHVDVFIAQRDGGTPISPWHAKPENGGLTPAKYVETQRMIFRYWRERGFDVTGEGIFWAHPPGEGFTGLQAMSWWYPGDPGYQMRIPERLMARGRTDRGGDGDFRFGSSMHGEEIYQRDKDKMPGFLGMFCRSTLPWFYLSRLDRLNWKDEALEYSEGVVARMESGRRVIRKGSFVLREDDDLFVPALWNKREIIAYSKHGCSGRKWRMPQDWASVARVDVYRITLEGLVARESGVAVDAGLLAVSLAPDQAVTIVPSGARPEGRVVHASVATARPTRRQAEWQDLELGLFIHYDMPVFKPGWDHRQYESRPEAAIYNPTKLNTDQWMEAARAMGARYAVFVAKHGSGFMNWQSDLYPYGMKQSPYKDGRGDIVRDFVRSCRKYGIRPGIYAHMGCNGYLEVDNPGLVNRGNGGTSEQQARYARICEGMLNELWGNYGPLTEIWFDGGVLDPDKGGPDMLPILHRLQPNAIVFQGPAASIRWIGNEDGVAPYPCWATVPEARDYSGAGEPDGTRWLPGECDVPIRKGTWMWEPNTEDRLYSVDELMDRYYRSVGHNCNLLLNANPGPDGLIPEADMRRYKEFGDEIRRRFGKSAAETSGAGDTVELALPAPALIDHVVVMEDIRSGERVREYAVEGLVDGVWKELSRGASIGHKKIDRFGPVVVSRVRWRSLRSVGKPRIRRLAIFAAESAGVRAPGAR